MATVVNLLCEQGSDLSFVVIYRRGEADVAVDVSGGTARMQARACMGAPVPFLDIDSESKGGITIGGADGYIAVFVPASVTATFVPSREAVYDMEFVDVAGKTNRVLEGRFRITPQVTR